MDPIKELGGIIEGQKTVTTKRLAPILKAFIKRYNDTVKKMNAQRNHINELQVKYQRASERLYKKKDLSEQHERLKLHHRNLETQYNLLLERYEQLKKGIE